MADWTHGGNLVRATSRLILTTGRSSGLRSQIRRAYLKFALGYIDRTIRLLSETETIIKAVTGIGSRHLNRDYGIECSYFVIESTNNPSRGIPLRALGSRAYVRLAEASSQADVPKTMSSRARFVLVADRGGTCSGFRHVDQPGATGRSRSREEGMSKFSKRIGICSALACLP